MSVIVSPIVIMSFNRPEMLARVLDSLKAQVGVTLDERNVFLFQDGAVNLYSRIRYSPDELIQASIAEFTKRFPNGEVMAASHNIGVCENFFRAENFVFGASGAECAYFFEDDLVLGPHYLETMEKVRGWAQQTDDMAYFSCYGDYYADAERSRSHSREFCQMEHHWGFGLFRSKWLAMQDLLRPYYQTVMGSDYNRRDHRRVLELYENLDIAPDATSQDAAKAMCCARLGFTRLNTVGTFAKYIGTTGLHMTEAAYKELGFENAVLRQNELAFPRFPTEAERSRLREQFMLYYSEIRKNAFDELRKNAVAKKLSPVRPCSPQEVVDAYRILLCRNPENPQVLYQYVNSQAVFDFLGGILASDEFKGLGNANANIAADAESIAVLYRLLLHREPDANAQAPRSADGHRDLREIALGLISSEEFSRLRVENI